jgi:squalene synthase HpnC
MTASAAVQPGKTHRDENFPVASRLIHRRYRDTILAFYRFARAADDVADHPSLPEDEKFALLDRLERTLLGNSDDDADALPLRRALSMHDLSPRHAQDLLKAFRMDVTKRRYQDWDDLIGYCTYSAMPVGRFVLDVHGESRATWPASDALCAALQIINHLQDCGADYRKLDRVYIPLDALDRDGLTPDALAADRASPGLRHCLQGLTQRTSALLHSAGLLSREVADLRLGIEISVIERLALRLIAMLMERDPLSQRVHLNAAEVAMTSASGAARALARRAFRSFGIRDKARQA